MCIDLWTVILQFEKWSRMSSSFSSSESGLRFLTDRHFPVRKNGPDRTVIFVMKMVRWIVDVP
jgi:hypothetical protein